VLERIDQSTADVQISMSKAAKQRILSRLKERLNELRAGG